VRKVSNQKPKKKEAKKLYLELDPKPDFECIRQKEGCFKKQDGGYNICPQSPCVLNRYKFGTHERIVSNFVSKEEFEEAFYYFEDLLSQSSFNCEVELWYKIKKEKPDASVADLPIGCRVFKKVNLIKPVLEDLRTLKRQIASATKETPMSHGGLDRYESQKVKFRRELEDCLDLLKHLTIDEREKRKKEIRDKKFDLTAVGTQMGELKPTALDMEIHNKVKDVLEGKKEKEKKEKISGF